MEQLFAGEGWYWGGGDYELNITLGPQSVDRVLAALEALWAHPMLEGPYLDPTREPGDQPVADPRSVGLPQSLSGIATLSDGARVLCRSWVSDLFDEYTLFFCIPVNALAVAWPQIGDFPFVGGRLSSAEDDSQGRRPLRAPRFPEEDDRAWQQPLGEWLADLGRAVFDAVPFPSALIGYEVPICLLSDDDERRLLEEMPEERPVGVLRREQDEVAWYPATSWGRFDVDWSQPDSWEELLRPWTWRLRLTHRLKRLFGSSEGAD